MLLPKMHVNIKQSITLTVIDMGISMTTCQSPGNKLSWMGEPSPKSSVNLLAVSLVPGIQSIEEICRRLQTDVTKSFDVD